jgi:phage-related protein
VKKFEFVSEAAKREYKALPESIQDTFGKDLRLIQFDCDPLTPVRRLNDIEIGVIELKVNGSPAYRCVYITKYLNTVFVLHSFEKTTNGTDRPAMNVARSRLKELKARVRKES